MTPAEAAKYLGTTPGTLNVWRCTGRHGVPYVKVGARVWYLRSELNEWLASRKRPQVESPSHRRRDSKR